MPLAESKRTRSRYRGWNAVERSPMTKTKKPRRMNPTMTNAPTVISNERFFDIRSSPEVVLPEANRLRRPAR